jgi:hypothetical protein
MTIEAAPGKGAGLVREQIESKVSGVTYEGRQEVIAEHCRAGKRLDVRPEPSNPYSENALGLWVRGKRPFNQSWHKVGYVPKDLADRLRKQLERGRSLTARITDVVGGMDGLNYGLRIELFVHEGVPHRKAESAEFYEPPAVWEAETETAPPRGLAMGARKLGRLAFVEGLGLIAIGYVIARIAGRHSDIFDLGIVVTLAGAGIWLIGFFSTENGAPAKPNHLADGNERTAPKSGG